MGPEWPPSGFGWSLWPRMAAVGAWQVPWIAYGHREGLAGPLGSYGRRGGLAGPLITVWPP